MKRFKAFIDNNKKIYIELIINDLRSRYNGSILGVAWGIIQPIITILIYWIVFQFGLRSGDRPDGVPYVFYMLAGAVPWFFFSDAFGGITTSFLDYSYLVKKLNFQIKLLPLVKIGSSFIIHIVFLIITAIIFNMGGYYADKYYFQVFYYMFAMMIFTLLIGVIAASMAVYIRDVIQIVGIIIQIGFWICPICWGTEILHGIPGILLKLNPMFYCIEGYRDCILYSEGFWKHPYITAYFWCVIAVLFVLARYMYGKLRPSFADVM